ncbi:hypothetical protein MUK42_10524 [Musa troglodytarum]|uniref:Secreted protein n=1 Tax=Musa troglodytarum TaxID=320322 RepID=A0A9E7JZ94_9LILI|nr:hypothetical protein MUK42_10524 [Musa troglodytarum]
MRLLHCMPSSLLLLCVSISVPSLTLRSSSQVRLHLIPPAMENYSKSGRQTWQEEEEEEEEARVESNTTQARRPHVRQNALQRANVNSAPGKTTRVQFNPRRCHKESIYIHVVEGFEGEGREMLPKKAGTGVHSSPDMSSAFLPTLPPNASSDALFPGMFIARRKQRACWAITR